MLKSQLDNWLDLIKFSFEENKYKIHFGSTGAIYMILWSYC